jgi:hypothetical protein
VNLGTSVNSVDQFAAEAARFEEWAHSSEFVGEQAAREALIRITSLYLVALQLPSPFTDNLGDGPDVDRLADENVAKVKAHRSIPIDFYGEVFDPHIIPPDEAIIGSIADDVLDISRDVATGLRAFESGNRNGAIWEWAVSFRHHWGRHAVSAIRAIHIWLADNAVERLSADD